MFSLKLNKNPVLRVHAQNEELFTGYFGHKKRNYKYDLSLCLQKYISDSFQNQRNAIVVTVIPLVMNWTDLRLVHNQKENLFIPFDKILGIKGVYFGVPLKPLKHRGTMFSYWLWTKRTSVWFIIKRITVTTITILWFWKQSEIYFCPIIRSSQISARIRRTCIREGSVSRHQGGPIYPPFEASQTSQHYGTEGFQGAAANRTAKGANHHL